MSASNVRHDEAFDRLQNLLTRLSAGDRLSTAEAARQSGLNEDTCRTVLERLVHVGLMSCEGHDGFVRRHLNGSVP